MHGRQMTGIIVACMIGDKCDGLYSSMTLTQWGQDKMAAISADDIFKSIFLNENFRDIDNISLKYVP